jgi:hypothetical protein
VEVRTRMREVYNGYRGVSLDEGEAELTDPRKHFSTNRTVLSAIHSRDSMVS